MLKSKIKINAEYEGELTLLKDSYHNAPYKVVHYGSRHFHKHLELILMSSSPGIMDRDEVIITVNVHEKAHLRLFTQSFNKLHPMQEGAVQLTNVDIKKEGVFQYIPHPVTPFARSIFKTTNEIWMDESATLIWGDIIASGRVHSGESFEFTRLHSLTRIYCNKKLVLQDNQLMEPGRQPMESILFFEGYTHQATLIYVSPYAAELKAELDEILLGQYKEITFGFTQCAPNAVMIRAMGNEGGQLHDWLTTMGQLCWEFSMHKKQQAMEAGANGQNGQEELKPAAKKTGGKKKKLPAKQKKIAAEAALLNTAGSGGSNKMSESGQPVNGAALVEAKA